ncbi:MAG TPA: selenium-dependent molybdenum cofactor biosynthesis protein YqeB [Syntrophorhabdales bacterium]|nr:selenium-dependent molybdenum cofactor biosynthesis protein YqeB [Syntrophorhabdales bacterium]
MQTLMVVVKGAGEMATGIAHRLFMSGITRIVMTEIARPLAVRRGVAFCEAIYEGAMEVEGVRAEYIRSAASLDLLWKGGSIGVIVDPSWNIVRELIPDVVVDAVMAKRNTGTRKDEALLVIGVGPDFRAPDEVHAVVESNRGHNLGKVIYKGQAEPYTGMPGVTEGYRQERVLRAPKKGFVKHVHALGDPVSKGSTILYVDEEPIEASIGGILRGLIREIEVEKGEKVGDIDPRAERINCYTISDKARAIAGGVLEAIMHRYNRPDLA